MIFRNRSKILIVCLSAVFFIAAVFLLVFWLRPQAQTGVLEMPNLGNTKPGIGLFEAINGLQIDELTALQRPLAVMVENHPDAWPQAGLAFADIVYETLAEGGITRFLALYQSGEVKQIGPVRSAREYFAQIANEWGALYAHVGGSNEVIKQLKNGTYKNLADANEYYNFDFFPRRQDKPEPHRIFTSTKKLRELIAFHDFSNTANYQAWKFKNDLPVATSTASQISIDFSRAGYEVSWEYDQTLNAYKRLQYFRPHLDEISGRQITAKNVAIQIVEVTPVPKDPLLQVDIDLASGGRAIIFQDGVYIDGFWKKEVGPDDSVGVNRTRFYDASGGEIKFNRGPIWLELVPKDKENYLKWQ